MEYYDNGMNSRRNNVHTIKVTFQTQDYKGYICYEMRGNCLGKDLLDFDLDTWDEYNIKNLKENTCKLKGDDIGFSMELKNGKGETCNPCYMDAAEVDEMVVAIEIIDCKKESEEE